MSRARDYERIVFFTGAGISKESGIPTYRGAGGIWSQYNYEDYACAEAFAEDPERVWEFHNVRREFVARTAPNAAHLAIAALAAEAPSDGGRPHVTVITQNIDGLHERAGSEGVIELHGSLWRTRCDACGAKESGREAPLRALRCACGRYKRPDIVWFGDMLDPQNIEAAERALSSCELLVSVGTSAVVFPAARLPEIARAHGAKLIEINPEDTPMSRLYDERIRSTATEGIAALLA